MEKHGLSILDRAYERLERGKHVDRTVSSLVFDLHALQLTLADEQWRRFSGFTCREHPLLRALHEDPFTRRSFEKPRGYAGDAVILDYIYAGLPAEEESTVTARGRSIFRAMQTSPSARAVRERKRLLTRYIDGTAARVRHARVLSVACGHLREAAASRAFLDGKLGEMVALDQDAESIAGVRRDFGNAVTPVCASVTELILRTLDLGQFDLIYAAGLYDYLADNSAALLTRSLFDMLNGGGRLLIGNFVPGFATGAYMEAYMDWHLISRQPARLENLARDIEPQRLENASTFVDSVGYVAYLELTNRRRCARRRAA